MGVLTVGVQVVGSVCCGSAGGGSGSQSQHSQITNNTYKSRTEPIFKEYGL